MRRETQDAPISGEPTDLAAALSGGVMLSIITGLGYLVVYAYEVGYCQRFRIPIALISITLPSLIFAAAIGCFVAICLWAASSLVPPTFFEDVRPTRAIEFTIAALLGLVWILTVVTGPQQSLIEIIPVVIAGIANAIFIFRARALEKDLNRLPNSIFTDVYKRYPFIMGLGTPLVALVIVGSFTLGSFRPMVTQYYPMLTNGPPKIVLAQFGNTLISARYDTRSQAVFPDFTLYDLSKTIPAFKIVNTGVVHCECQLAPK